MLKYLLLLLISTHSFAETMITAEKWVCTSRGLTRVVRLYAPGVGQAPCKVFYFKRLASYPTDTIQEAAQNAGTVSPIYYSNGNGGFCARKLEAFIEDKKDHSWTCSKV